VSPAGRSRPRVLVIGATSAVARALAGELAVHGRDLVLAGRDRPELETIAADLAVRHGVATAVCVLDVLDAAGHEAALGPWLEDETLEGVVVAVGYLGDQRLAEMDLAETRRILDTNFTGCVALLNLVALRLEARGRGFICALSSVAGDRGRQSNYLYGAAKAGLSVYLQGLRNRLHRAGVRVLTVKPGFVDTAMTFGRPGLFLVASPGRVARSIFRAIEAGRDVVYVPGFWRPLMLAVRSVPERLFKRLRL
jgi:short-subunit dehydrogenase